MYVEVWLHISPAAWPQGSFMTSQVPAAVLSSMREEQTTQNEEIQIKSINHLVFSVQSTVSVKDVFAFIFYIFG